MSKVFQDIIQNYINSYNSFDVDGMLLDMHKDIKFENSSNGEVDLLTNGISEFRNQAEQSKKFFKDREQKITAIRFDKNEVEVEIDYTGTLSMNFPIGLKVGSSIGFKGKSVFKFKDEKIIGLRDDS